MLLFCSTYMLSLHFPDSLKPTPETEQGSLYDTCKGYPSFLIIDTLGIVKQLCAPRLTTDFETFEKVYLSFKHKQKFSV
jgi:hypothetical protein